MVAMLGEYPSCGSSASATHGLPSGPAQCLRQDGDAGDCACRRDFRILSKSVTAKYMLYLTRRSLQFGETKFVEYSTIELE